MMCPLFFYSLKWDHIRDQLDTYAAIAGASKGGRIGIEEFADYLKLPVSDVLRELFLLFDRVSIYCVGGYGNMFLTFHLKCWQGKWASQWTQSEQRGYGYV